MKLYRFDSSISIAMISNKQLDFIHTMNSKEITRENFKASVNHYDINKIKYSLVESVSIDDIINLEIINIPYTNNICYSVEHQWLYQFGYSNMYIIYTIDDFELVCSVLKDKDFVFHLTHTNDSFATVGVKSDDIDSETCINLLGLEKYETL